MCPRTEAPTPCVLVSIGPRSTMKRRTVDEDSEVGSTMGDDEEEEEERVRPAKKSKRNRSAFIDDEVDVEDEEDEEEDDEEEGPDEYEEEEGAEAVRGDEAERANRALDAQRRKEEEAKLQEEVRQRYESGQAHFTNAEDEEDEQARFRDLPDATRDPKLWLMRCKDNKEKMLVSTPAPAALERGNHALPRASW